MVQIQPKRNLPAWIHAPWSLAILLVVTCALFWNVIVIAIKSAETKAKRDQAEERLAELTKQQASLEEALNALNTPEGTETVLRDHLRVAKEGEELIVVVDQDIPDSSSKKGRVSGFFDKIFGKNDE